MNYIGQLRIYSLVDLCILLVAFQSTRSEFVGVFALHIGFLAYLENRHGHEGRHPVPVWICPVFCVFGLLLVWKVEVALFFLFSYLYAKKNKKSYAMLSPFCRGLQMFFLSAAILGYRNRFSLIVFLVFLFRNAVGDWRDVEKDRRQGMRTLPIVFGAQKDMKHLHLAMMLVSSTIWWSHADISVGCLFVVCVIELTTYRLTPR